MYIKAVYAGVGKLAASKQVGAQVMRQLWAGICKATLLVSLLWNIMNCWTFLAATGRRNGAIIML